MKVAQINAVYAYSSTGRTTAELHYAIKGNGDDSYVFCTNENKPSEGIFRVGNKFDWKCHALLKRITGKEGMYSVCATNKLVRQLEAIKPDVIVLRNLHANYVNIPILFNYIAKYDIPVVIVLHDCWFFTGQCCYFTEYKCMKWQDCCFDCPHKDSTWFFDRSQHNFIMKRKCIQATTKLAVIGVSDWITSEALKSPIFSNASVIKRIYNWIDLTKFYPRDASKVRARLRMNIHDFIVLGVSQGWSENKGLYHMVKLAERNPDIKVVLVGRMDSPVPNLHNLVCLGETKSIDQLAEYYSMADVLLNCSIQETFGKITAEALACGTPIIVNNATANPEFVKDGLCGFSVNNNDYDEIIAAISEIRKKGRSVYSEHCISKARRDFSMENNLKDYLNLFTSLQS